MKDVVMTPIGPAVPTGPWRMSSGVEWEQIPDDHFDILKNDSEFCKSVEQNILAEITRRQQIGNSN